LSSLRGVAQPG